jgi:hypothetical protein
LDQILILLVELCCAFSLAACAGLRAFLPLLIISIFARAGHVQLGESFSFLASTPALIVFGGATALELIGDFIPAVDHLLDTAGAFIKPIAGAVLASAVIVKMDPVLAIVLGIIVGGSLSEVIHLKKAGLRLISTGLTGGVANPLLSLTEDAGALLGTILSILAPIITFCLLCVAVLVAIKLYSKIKARGAH